MTIPVDRVLGRTGVRIGPLTLGTMNFGRWQEEDESIRIIQAALDAGITAIDTADVYAQGVSEQITGRAIAGRRDDLDRNQRKLAAADALGRLAEQHGLTLVELSVAFALNHPAISSVIIGPRTAEHLETYLKASTVELNAEILDRIDEIVDPGTQFLDRDTGRDTPSLQLAELRRTN